MHLVIHPLIIIYTYCKLLIEWRNVLLFNRLVRKGLYFFRLCTGWGTEKRSYTSLDYTGWGKEKKVLYFIRLNWMGKEKKVLYFIRLHWMEKRENVVYFIRLHWMGKEKMSYTSLDYTR